LGSELGSITLITFSPPFDPREQIPNRGTDADCLRQLADLVNVFSSATSASSW
jgi:hypothetical protein